MKIIILTALTFMATVTVSSAQAQQAKSQYNLFNPTPREQMREFDSDRPGAGDSPKTVDAGHYRFESALFEYGRPRPETETYGINSFFLIAGLTNSTELQIGWDTYRTERTHSEKEEGVGDMEIRYKWNLAGNDSGEIALGLLPFVTLPTSTHNMGNTIVAGGLELPFNIEINDQVSFSSTPSINIEQTDSTDKHHAEFQMTMGLEHECSEKLASFVELVSVSSEEDWKAGAEFGFMFHPSRDLQFDISAHVGLTDADEDFSSAFGVTYRM